jgi:predicted amidohydrolase YtcJ
MDAARRWAGAVAVRDGRIVYVGPDSLPAGLAGLATEVVNLSGAMVLPGFQDAHVHPLGSGVELGECHLHELTSAKAVADSIRACAEAAPALPWVRGGGWQLPLFPDGNPSRAMLDAAVPDRPAALEAADGHSLWVNSRALALAGITRDTPDPANGRIERDPRTREPSGTLRESAMDLVAGILPERTDAELAAGLDRAQRRANRFGITSLFAATADEAGLRAYTAADRAGRLTVRVVAASYPDPDEPDSIVPRARAWRGRYTTPRVRPISVKLFQDGVIEARTAALLAPYLDRKGDSGTPVYDQATLDRVTAGLDREGFQVHVHAIGDRAIRMALDAFAHARTANGTHDARHAITHLELIAPADIPGSAPSAWSPTSRRSGPTATSISAS